MARPTRKQLIKRFIRDYHEQTRLHVEIEDLKLRLEKCMQRNQWLNDRIVSLEKQLSQKE